MATYDLKNSIPAISSLKTGDILNCSYSGVKKEITLPTGTYKLEVWGAQGGYRSSSSAGGMGGYSVGTIAITTSTKFILYVGGSGNTGGTAGGFNGGGMRYSYAGGGGASDIRLKTDSLYARVIVAGGGGSDGSTSYAGSAGGGTSGVAAGSGCGNNYSQQGTATGVAGGTTYLATSRWTTANPTTAASTYSGFGFGGAGPYRSSGYGGAGGGGWYGGGGSYPDSSADDDKGGAGGSGYVYTSSTASQYPSGCLLNSSYYLTSASTTAGTSSFKSPSGTNETGHSGNGYARITIVSLPNQTLTFNANGGTSTPNSITVAYGQGATLPNAIAKLSEAINFTTIFYGAGGSNVTGTGLKTANYTFAGWNTKADGSGTNYDAGSTMSFVQTQTLYAKWTLSYTYSANNQIKTVPVPTRASTTSTFTVTGVSNGGNADTSFTANQIVAYQFKEWNTRMDGAGTSYPSTSTATFDENTLLYAIWTPVTTFTNNTIDRLPIPTKTGGTFESWNTAADGSGGTYQPTSGAAFQGPTTLYAQWRNVPTYRAIVYKNGQWTVLKPYVYSNGAWGRYKPSLK